MSHDACMNYSFCTMYGYIKYVKSYLVLMANCKGGSFRSSSKSSLSSATSLGPCLVLVHGESMQTVFSAFLCSNTKM